jgi:hypothetical protein
MMCAKIKEFMMHTWRFSYPITISLEDFELLTFYNMAGPASQPKLV